MDPTPILEKSNKDKNIKRNDYSKDSDTDYGCWEIKLDDFNC